MGKLTKLHYVVKKHDCAKYRATIQKKYDFSYGYLSTADYIFKREINASYLVIRRYFQGGEYPCARGEGYDEETEAESSLGEKDASDIYPVWFKNLDVGVEIACAAYSWLYHIMIDDVKENFGVKGNITKNECAFLAYHKVQRPNKKLTSYKEIRESKDNFFLNFDFSSKRLIDDKGSISQKSYYRWAVWRFNLLSGYFDEDISYPERTKQDFISMKMNPAKEFFPRKFKKINRKIF